MSSPNSSSVSTLTSPSDISINDEVCSLQNKIYEKINYSDLSKTQARDVHNKSGVMKKQVELLANKIWDPMIL